MVWAGRRFKTPAYKKYETEISYLLPKKLDIPEGDLEINITWGMSSSMSDIDNPTKPFLDILQKQYGFNDKQIFRLNLIKEKVKKGEDFIKCEILSLK